MHDAMGSGDRTKIILMFATVLALSVGGIFYFFKIYQPKERIADAQAEIADWDARWIETRNCLLGATPGSSKVSEALAIRELSPDPWERKSCTQLVSALSRGEAEDTRVPAVEEAWRALDKAASKVAVSFVSHVDPGGDAMRKRPDPLPDALDELEAAYALLRRAAELPPALGPPNANPLVAAPITPITFDNKRILSVQEPYMTSRAGMLSFGTVDGSEIQLQLVANKPPVITAVGAGMQRAIPDGTWGARAIPDSVEVGQLDDKGMLTTAATLKLAGPTQVITVVGTWADGVVVYGAGNQLVVARCKTGTCTAEKPVTVRSMAFATDAETGFSLVVWGDDQSAMWALHLDPAALDTKPDELGQEGFPKLVCLARETAWMQYALEGDVRTMELRAMAGSQAKGHTDVPDDEHGLMSCSQAGAVLFEYGPSYRRCTQGTCEATAIKAHRSRIPATATPNSIVGVETRGGVLAVRKNGPTDFYAAPNGLVPLVAMTDGNVVDVLGWTAEGLVIARVSAR